MGRVQAPPRPLLFGMLPVPSPRSRRRTLLPAETDKKFLKKFRKDDNKSEVSFIYTALALMLRKISLANLGIVLGSALFVVGTIAYITNNATVNITGFLYGFPVILGGFALKASELKPIPFTEATPPEVLILREKQATPTQNQLRQDVTRYRYGQAAHLDEALGRLKLAPNDKERPVLQGLRESSIDGFYTLVLEFDSPHFPLDVWQQKQEKIATFFGPGLRAEVSQPSENRIDLALIVLKG